MRSKVYDKAWEWFEEATELDLTTADPDEVLDNMAELFGPHGSNDLFQSLLSIYFEPEYLEPSVGPIEAARATAFVSRELVPEAGEEAREKARYFNRQEKHQEKGAISSRKRAWRGIETETYVGKSGTHYKKYRDVDTGKFMSASKAKRIRSRK